MENDSSHSSTLSRPVSHQKCLPLFTMSSRVLLIGACSAVTQDFLKRLRLYAVHLFHRRRVRLTALDVHSYEKAPWDFQKSKRRSSDKCLLRVASSESKQYVLWGADEWGAAASGVKKEPAVLHA